MSSALPKKSLNNVCVMEKSLHSNSLRRACIIGTGSYAPERVVTNRDLEALVDTTDEWITTRTGMKERHIARPDEASSDMGAESARRAIAAAGITPEEIDLIIAPTITPDTPWPNTGCYIQEKIGAKNAWCVGIEAACSGFIYGLWLARNMIASGAVNTVLVAACEKISSIVDWKDRATCVLFGDGSGAAVLRATDHPTRGIIGGNMGSDGSLTGLLIQPAGGSRMPTTEETLRSGMNYLKMAGKETYRHAVTRMTDSSVKLLESCGMTFDDVDWFIPHQANLRIISAVGQRMGVPVEKFIINIEKYANTSSATIGLALDEGVRDGRIKRGDKVLLVAFGGGLTWGSLLLEW